MRNMTVKIEIIRIIRGFSQEVPLPCLSDVELFGFAIV
jgi:hypothetical protein